MTGAIRLFSNGWEVVGPNGINLPGVGPQLGSRTATQGVFVPLPGNNDIVYLFLVDGFAGSGVDANGYGGLSYSIIDLTLNGGVGGYVTTDVQLLTPTTEKLTVIKGCTGEDHWIVCHAWNSDAFYSYHLTAGGLDPVPVVSNVGVVHQSSGGPTPTFETIGQMKGSRDHSKLALVVGRGLQRVELFNFDNSTGVVGPLIFSDGNFAQLTGDRSLYGLEFSPDGSKLYTSVETQQSPFIYQYDISSGQQATIAASRTLIFDQPNALVYGGLQLGPDGRIYVAKFGDELDVIVDPNAPGAACGYTEDGQQLDQFATCVLGLPQLLDLDVPVPESASLTVDDCGSTAVVPFINGPWPLPITGFAWDFDDPASGAANTSTLRDPQHTFSTAGTYNVELIVFYGCASDTIVQAVTVNGAAPVVQPLANVSLCPGDAATLTAQVTGTATVLWSTGETTPSITVNAAGTYMVTATNACGSASQSVTVTLNGAAPVVQPLANVSLCPGDAATLTAQVTGTATVLWSTGETTPSITVNAAGTFMVTATNACGSASQSATVTLNGAAPVVQPLANVSLCPGDAATLTAQVTGTATVLWSTGETTPSITVNAAGTYTVTATNACGSASWTAVVELLNNCVGEDDLVHLPNAFTPNGDGINDGFGAESGSVLTDFELLVFDRWGELIWSTVDVWQVWDGNVDGMPAQDGVYATRLMYRTSARERIVRYGHVVLLR